MKTSLPTVKILKGIALAAAVSLALPSQLLAAPEKHEIDPAHSTVGFRIKHLFAYVTGRFNDVKGTIVVDAEKPEASSVKVAIATASVDTANEKRDEHLRNADFFNVDKFKEITFESKKVEKTGEKTGKVTGDLTLNGVTKEVVLDVTYFGKGADGWGKVRSGWQGKTNIKRSDFGMTYGKEVEGVALIGDDVEITLDIEGIVEP